jgi:hypothetical protein
MEQFLRFSCYPQSRVQVPNNKVAKDQPLCLLIKLLRNREYGRGNMLNVVRRSQIIGSIAIDSSTSARFAELEEVWLDDSGRIAYFSGEEAYNY